jgi:hypothetical protein
MKGYDNALLTSLHNEWIDGTSLTKLGEKSGINRKTLARIFKSDDFHPDSSESEMPVQTDEFVETIYEEDIDYVVTAKSITITKGADTRVVREGVSTYAKVRELILKGDLQGAWELSSPKEAIVKMSVGSVAIDGNKISFKGVEIQNEMVNRLMSLLQKNGAQYAGHIAAFADKCMENPSFRAVKELLRFMEHNTLPICPDGDFLTYKKVRHDYLDCHSSTVLNKPAALMSESELSTMPVIANKQQVKVDVIDTEHGKFTEVSMPRNYVDDDYTSTCSDGLHVCSFSYLRSFMGTVYLVTKVNPKDVVSVPSDYKNAKMRTCRYVIVREISEGCALKNMFASWENVYGQ